MHYSKPKKYFKVECVPHTYQGNMWELTEFLNNKWVMVTGAFKLILSVTDILCVSYGHIENKLWTSIVFTLVKHEAIQVAFLKGNL